MKTPKTAPSPAAKVMFALMIFMGCAPLGAQTAKIIVTHDLSIARPSETITVPWSEVVRHLPGALLQKIAVKDAAGRVRPYQVTNIAPQAKDPEGRGVAYGDLIFQHDFAAGEGSVTFTVEKIEGVAPVFPTRAYARFVPERLDDFAWENDRIARRTYGPALAAPAPAGVTKEVLVTSGLDVWCKRVDYPVIDRWYNKGHDHYHTDQGEGMDMFQVGPSRGCGGTGIWDGQRLHVSGNFQGWRILANGPVRAIFELSYNTWSADGVYVSEVKRFTVDAGHNLDRIESTWTASGNVKELTVAVGLNRNPTDRGQDPDIALTARAGDGSFTQWIRQKSNGQLGTAVIVPGAEFAGFAEDARNHLVLAKVAPGKPLVYFAGAGWDRSGQFRDQAEWEAHVAAAAARARSPVRVTLAPAS